MGIRIVHIAPQNIAGVVSTFVKCEKELGFDSILVTMSRHPHGFENGICLDYPFFAESWFRFARKLFMKRKDSDNLSVRQFPPQWKPGSKIEKFFFDLRDRLYDKIIKQSGILEIIKEAHIVVLDGGLGLRRDGKYELEWAEKNGRLVSVFYGSDLRSRGVIPALDNTSSLHFTLEFDHLKLHPKVKYIFYPFDLSRIPQPPYKKPAKIRVGHSPTKRETKGTDKIIRVTKILEKKNLIEFVLIENLPYKKAVEIQSTCHIFIDQLSGLGYGLSGLQALAMGIPTLVNLTDEHNKFLGDHPFVNFNENNLEEKLLELVDNHTLRKELGEKGKEWVRKTHDPMLSTKTIINEYKALGWI